MIDKMKTLNITIIGCGWLGLPLGIALVNKGHRVYGSCKSTNKLPKLENVGIHSFLFDLGTNTRIDPDITSTTNVLIVMLPPVRKDHIHFYGEGLVALCKQFPSVQGVIFTSSTGVYPQIDGNFDEGYTFKENERNSSLFQAETALRNELKAKLTILRLGGLVGPNRHPIFRLAGKLGLKNPECPVNLVHQKDVLTIIEQLIEHQKFGDIFNVVHPDHPSRKSYYTAMALRHKLVPPEFKDTNDIKRLINGQKIEHLLDFQAENPIE